MQYVACPSCYSILSAEQRLCDVCGKRQWKMRRFFKKSTHLAWLLAIICSVILVALQISYQRHTYLMYQPAQCFVIHKEVVAKTYYSKNTILPETRYSPEFVYAVYTSGVYHGTEQGYVGPGPLIDTSFQTNPDSAQDAQDIIAGFQLYQAYPCWYSPENIHHAFLFLSSDIAGSAILGFIIYLALLFLMFFLLCLFYKLWRLEKKGVRTRGRVIRHEQHYSRSSIRKISVVAFRTNTEPVLNCEVNSSGRLRMGKGVSVLYDPADPQGNAVTGYLPYRVLFLLLSFSICLVLVFVVFLARSWFFV